eukprot:TRINITY_DN6829_c0_g1_i1.p1 TRINITY_DN6829_c0_g1~~TRINITY_DN6829_c0_g1_i1.p1  ORF type:complete len:555 (+),score=48.01 TRINITY_DN6829_c0_g1_i1:91-1755(+)
MSRQGLLCGMKMCFMSPTAKCLAGLMTVRICLMYCWHRMKRPTTQLQTGRDLNSNSQTTMMQYCARVEMNRLNALAVLLPMSLALGSPRKFNGTCSCYCVVVISLDAILVCGFSVAHEVGKLAAFWLESNNISTEIQATLEAILQKQSDRTIKVGSICSGTGMDHLLLKALNDFGTQKFGNNNAPRFVHEFFCESSEAKGKALAKLHAVPVFQNMDQLKDGLALDWNGTYRVVRKVKGLLDGYPCTSISSQNTRPASFLNSSSATGNGFRFLLGFVDYCDADGDYLEWILTENVRNMMWHSSQYDERPMDIQNKSLDERGFLPSSVLAQSARFSLKHSRHRAIGLYVKKTKTKAFLPDLAQTFFSFECRPLPLSQFLCDDTGIEADSRHSGPKPSRGTVWKKQLAMAESKFGQAAVQQNLNRLKCLGTLASVCTERELSVCAVAITDLLSRDYDPYNNLLIIQVDQDVNRSTFIKTDPTLCPCILPNGKYVVSKRWSLLTGTEKLRLQGLSLDEIYDLGLSKYSDGEKSDYAGNMFSGPVLLAAMLTVVAHWKP